LRERAKIGIVAAMEREVALLVKGWDVEEREHDGRRYKFFECDAAVLVCGGIGAAPARRATEAVIALYKPVAVESVGFAGALGQGAVGDVVVPNRVVDASDGSSFAIGAGQGTLITFSSIAGVEQKKKLAKAYGAEWVDMEAAAVARGAEARGVAFSVIKVVSDDHDFAMPEMSRFVDYAGRFQTVWFSLYAALRPWLWFSVVRLARNSRRASRALCRALSERIQDNTRLSGIDPKLHPMQTASK
jgi:adenosylhomocysteine nucleosidase